MNAKIILLALAGACALSGPALAQSSTVNGAAGGAVAGAVVGGPAGAAVGAVVGAVVGTVIDPPPREVVTYVEERPVPDNAVVLQQKVVVGRELPGEIEVSAIPQYPKYGYAVVNHERVIVEPSSRKVIQIVE